MATTTIHTKDADTGPARSLGPVAEPVTRRAGKIERAGTGKLLAGSFHAATGGDDFLIQGQASPHQRGQPGGGAAVAYIGGNAGNGTGPLFAWRGVIRWRCPEKGRQGGGFHAVFGRVAAGVRLHKSHGGRIDPGIVVSPLQGLAIGVLVRYGCGTAGIADTADDRIDPVAVPLRIIEALEYDTGSSFTHNGAVCPLIKGKSTA